MPPGAEADPLYLDSILALIDLIEGSLGSVDEATFLANRDQGDATALRLGSIGELGRKLSHELKARHPEVDWAGMYGLRNIVAHHYDRLDYSKIWIIASRALHDLKAACRAELDAVGG